MYFEATHDLLLNRHPKNICVFFFFTLNTNLLVGSYGTTVVTPMAVMEKYFTISSLQSRSMETMTNRKPPRMVLGGHPEWCQSQRVGWQWRLECTRYAAKLLPMPIFPAFVVLKCLRWWTGKAETPIGVCASVQHPWFLGRLGGKGHALIRRNLEVIIQVENKCGPKWHPSGGWRLNQLYKHSLL